MSLRIGLAVHPTRDVEEPLQALRRWAHAHTAELFQVEVDGQQQHVASAGRPEDADLVMAIGGDGTALAAIRVASRCQRPVLGVACGSLGALTSVAATEVPSALDRFVADSWRRVRLPALAVQGQGNEFLAFNDLAVVRGGSGQVRTGIRVDGVLFGRLAGDGCIVSTPVGSSAYALAAGGPLLEPTAQAFLFTPLPSHGGSLPPLVVGHQSELELKILGGYAGARLELDGKLAERDTGSLRIRLRPNLATVVAFDGQEPFLEGLRRRGVLADSPRLLAEDKRSEQ